MKIVAVIPARMASSRFPGKPLAPILGRPMVEHVYWRTAMSSVVDATYVATCDVEIKERVEAFGGRAVMTSPTHERGTDRVAEAAFSLGLAEDDIVVNVQGDEPTLHPDMIGLAVEPLRRDARIGCTNLTAVIGSDDEHRDPNEIKVVADRAGRALYMSRAPIPTNTRAQGDWPRLKQVCVIGFRLSTLRQFVALPQTPLERAESIDMLRFIENDVPVVLVPSAFRTQAVDTMDGLRRVERLLADDPLMANYPRPR
jgi:3-deoxy-manno-octulosonate cytidylyltransferase (CMP-KDO synthetase)